MWKYRLKHLFIIHHITSLIGGLKSSELVSPYGVMLYYLLPSTVCECLFAVLSKLVFDIVVYQKAPL